MPEGGSIPCPSCGQGVPPGNRFCGNCGSRVDDTGESPAAAPASLDALFAHLRSGEQRPVTILMTDITGFTSLGERLDPEQLYELLNDVFAELVPVLTMHGAHIDKYMGDEIMALFGAPVAMERCAERAVLAALAVRERLEQMQTEGRFGEALLRLHTGINLGVVMVGPVGSEHRLDYTVIGDAVNLAKRLEEEAREGEIYISDTVREAAGAAISSEAVGEITVKNRQAPVQVYRVTGAKALSGGPSELATDVPLVARDEQLAVLCSRSRDAQAGRQCCVGVVGAAGIGKSKLIAHWRSLGDHGFRVAQASCYACGKRLPYLLVVDLLARLGGLRLEGWPPRAVAPDVAAGAGEPPTRLRAARLVQRIQNPPPEQDPAWREGVSRGLIEVLQAAVADGPLCLVIDDAQWMDEASRELLEEVLSAGRAWPLLVVAASRETDSAWIAGVPGAELVALPPLPRAVMEDLVRAWAAPDPIPRDTVRAICDRAEGHPYFARELVRALRDSHAGGLPVGGLPGSLHELFLVQLDRLPVPLRRLVQAASVVGEPLTPVLLGSAMGEDATLAADLMRGALAENLLRLSADGEHYVFARRLLFEAAYETIPPGQRRSLHARIADVLTERLDEMESSALHAAAHHAYLGHRDERAMDLLLRSAQRYTAHYANHDAIKAARRALEIISQLAEPERLLGRRLEALLILTQCYQVLGELAQAEGTVAEAEVLCEDCTDGALVARVATVAAALYWMLGALDEAYQRFSRAHDDWLALGNNTRVAHTTLGMGLCAQELGDREKALRLFRQAAATGDTEPWVRGAALNNAGVLLLQDGRYSEAEGYVRQGLAENEASEDRRGTANTKCSLGEVLYRRGRLEEAAQWLRSAMEDAAAVEDASCRRLAALTLVGVEASRGQLEAAALLLREESGPLPEGAGCELQVLDQLAHAHIACCDSAQEAEGWAAPEPPCPDQGGDAVACWSYYAECCCLLLERCIARREGDSETAASVAAQLAETLPRVRDARLAAHARWVLEVLLGAGRAQAALAPETDGPGDLYDLRAQRLRSLM